MKITLDSIFGELLEEYPHTEMVLKKYLGEAYCLSCPGKMFDTIGNGASIHGLNDEEAGAMLRDLQVVVDQYESGALKREEHRGSSADDGATGVAGQGDSADGNEGGQGGDAGTHGSSGTAKGGSSTDDDIIGSPWWVSWGDDNTDDE